MDTACHILIDVSYIWLPLLLGGGLFIGLMLGMKITKVEKDDG